MKKTKKSKSEDIVFNVTPKAKPVRGDFHVSATLRGLFFFLIVVAPIAVFAWIIYQSPSGFDTYRKFTDSATGKHVWDFVNAPNGNNVYIIFWVGMACIIATVILIAVFGVITHFVANKKVQSGYVFSVIVIAVIGVLLTALAQYLFAKIFDFIEYESSTQTVGTGKGNVVSYEGETATIATWGQELTDALKNVNPLEYKWMPASIVWWVMFVQFMFVFSVEVTLQNALHANDNLNDYERYIADTKQDETGIDFNKLNKFFKNTFRASDKSVAMFLIIAAMVIVIPNFVYSIIGTVPKTRMYATIEWGYQVPTLIGDISDDGVISNTLKDLSATRLGNGFVVSSLPIILEGLTIATLFFFIAMLLRGKNVSNKIFIAETIILFVEVIALISVSLASKVYVHRMWDYWNTDNHIGAFSDAINKVITFDGEKFTGPKGYPLSGIDQGQHIEWLDSAATIAEAIIAYAWVLGCFGLIGNAIYKMGYFKSDKLVTYENGILNN